MRRFKIKGIAALLTLVILIGQCFVGGALATSPPSYHSSASVEEMWEIMLGMFLWRITRRTASVLGMEIAGKFTLLRMLPLSR